MVGFGARTVSRVRTWWWQSHDLRMRVAGWVIGQTVCRFLGCQIEVESVVSPDSGTEDIWCARCGKGKHIVYY
jgi:hypothetical protein